MPTCRLLGQLDKQDPLHFFRVVFQKSSRPGPATQKLSFKAFHTGIEGAAATLESVEVLQALRR